MQSYTLFAPAIAARFRLRADIAGSFGFVH